MKGILTNKVRVIPHY